MLTRNPRDRGPQGPRGLPTAFGGARRFAPRLHEMKKQKGFPTVILGAETETKTNRNENKQDQKQTKTESQKPKRGEKNKNTDMETATETSNNRNRHYTVT